jgi:hypothetical protein
MNDDKVDAYLFDPTAEGADEVRDIEARLQPLRWSAEARPLPLSRGQARLPVLHYTRRVAFALAAVLVLVFAGVAFWLWTWPAGRSWRATSGSIASLPVGQVVQPSTSTRVRIARIGWMDIAAQSAVTLLSTRSNEHRLAMSAGRVHVSVWAPPRSVAVRTPSGNVVDLGCEFIVNADDKRTSVDVVSGWVQLDNEVGEVVVPGGATSEMRRSRRPTVPVFRTATPSFQTAMRQLDDRADAPATALRIVLSEARRRDVFTLLVLAMRRPADRQGILERAAQLMPPRDATVLLRARRDDNAVWTWVHELPLPPEKGWVRNWRDRFPMSR